MARAINSYRDLVVWNEAMDLAEAAYRVSAQLPREEAYGLSSQIRRSAGSVPANIAEGYGRDSKGAYVQQLRVAGFSQRIRDAHLACGTRRPNRHVRYRAFAR